jgi:hypothetical protein
VAVVDERKMLQQAGGRHGPVDFDPEQCGAHAPTVVV